MAANSPEAPCGCCGAATAPYTCPRCNRRLCSLGCYRSHGACAEAFYREQVLAALAAERVPPPPPPPQRRARGGRGAWSRLSPSERAEFLRLLRSGEAAELLPPWRPWWWGPADPRAGPAPPPPGPVPPLGSLGGRAPSPLLRFQLPSALYGYAFALCLHGGDETLLPELPAAALAASAALRGRCPFASAREALEAARRDAAAAGYPPGPLGEAGAALEVARLLEGGGAGSDVVGTALAHLARLFRDGERRLRDEAERGRFRRARRKCRYLLSWLAEAVTSAANSTVTSAVTSDVTSETASKVRSEVISTVTSSVSSPVTSLSTSTTTPAVTSSSVTGTTLRPTMTSAVTTVPPSTVTSSALTVTSEMTSSVTSGTALTLTPAMTSSASPLTVKSAVTSSTPPSTMTSAVTSSAPPSTVTSSVTSETALTLTPAVTSPMTSWLAAMAAEARRVHEELLREQRGRWLVRGAVNEPPLNEPFDEQLVSWELEQLELGEGLRGEGRQLIQELD